MTFSIQNSNKIWEFREKMTKLTKWNKKIIWWRHHAIFTWPRTIADDIRLNTFQLFHLINEVYTAHMSIPDPKNKHLIQFQRIRKDNGTRTIVLLLALLVHLISARSILAQNTVLKVDIEVVPGRRRIIHGLNRGEREGRRYTAVQRLEALRWAEFIGAENEATLTTRDWSVC